MLWENCGDYMILRQYNEGLLQHNLSKFFSSFNYFLFLVWHNMLAAYVEEAKISNEKLVMWHNFK